ncbi:MAG: ABC transporter ATP-binding protein [Solirubrobacteraceae bacterium]
MTLALRAQSVSVRYGGVQALEDVSLEIAPGQLVGLIGPNGAGKTSFIDAITGFTAATGTVEVGDTDVFTLAPDLRARHGLARTWQSAELFDDLTVRENLAVTAGRPSLRESIGELLTGRAARHPVVDETLAFLDLSMVADATPDSLSQGQRKLVGVARALAAQPRVVCLDEPAAGLDTSESQRLGRHLREIVNRGTAMLLVDHDMGLVLNVCDLVVVLNFGRVIASAPPHTVRRDPRVIEAYLGKAAGEVTSAAPTAGSETR